jgi:hypothetical protein
MFATWGLSFRRMSEITLIEFRETVPRPTMESPVYAGISLFEGKMASIQADSC